MKRGDFKSNFLFMFSVCTILFFGFGAIVWLIIEIVRFHFDQFGLPGGFIFLGIYMALIIAFGYAREISKDKIS